MSNLLYDRLFGCHQGEQKPFLIFSDGSQQSYDSFLRQTAWQAIMARFLNG